MRPGKALVKVLYEKGVYSIASLVCDLNRRFLRNPFQETAVHMLTKNSKINTKDGVKSRKWFKDKVDDRSIWYMWRGGEETSESLHTREGDITRDDLLPYLDEKPYVAVYMGFTQYHTEKEMRKLRLQLWEVLNSVRYFLWDANMVLVDRPKWYDWKPSPYVKDLKLEEIDERSTILFDPNAPKAVSSEEILKADAYLFGGIIDKEVPRPGLTSKIPCERCLRRRIELRGSVIGVPLTINKLAFAVLMARYELGGDLERAIVKVMSSRERRWRLAWEAVQAYRNGIDPLEHVLKVAKFLGASKKEIIRALKMSGIEGGKLAERLQASDSGKD